MCAVRLDREQLEHLNRALLAETRVLLSAPSAPAGELLTWRSLARLVLRKPETVSAWEAQQVTLDDTFAGWASVDRSVASMELVSLRTQALALQGYALRWHGGEDERAPELQARAIAALTEFYFGEHRPDDDFVAETQLAWAAAQATKDLVPVFRTRRENCAIARERYRELWDEWASAQQPLLTA